jgi:hypothetical protein
MNINLNRPNLTGKHFRVPEYDCTWVVLYYFRCDSWVCKEEVHNTTCHFFQKDIINGLLD